MYVLVFDLQDLAPPPPQARDPEKHPACSGQPLKQVTAQPQVRTVPRARSGWMCTFTHISVYLEVAWSRTRYAVSGLLLYCLSLQL